MISGVVLRTQPDGKLAALAADGSEAAFEAIVHRYRRMLLSYCRRLLLSESRSEDVVQQVFLNAWTALRAGVEVREVRSWLYRITHNHAVSALRRPGFDFDELNEALCSRATPDSDQDGRALMRETLVALSALPELQREAILRTAVHGYSYREVASALGITDKAVRGLIYRARTSLRQGLAAFAPHPLVLWAAGQARRGGSLSQWLGQAVSGGGSVSGTAMVLKGAGVLATSAVVVAGTVGGRIDPSLPLIGVHSKKSAATHNSRPSSTPRLAPTETSANDGQASTSWGVRLRGGTGRIDLTEARAVLLAAGDRWGTRTTSSGGLTATRAAYRSTPALTVNRARYGAGGSTSPTAGALGGSAQVFRLPRVGQWAPGPVAGESGSGGSTNGTSTYAGAARAQSASENAQPSGAAQAWQPGAGQPADAGSTSRSPASFGGDPGTRPTD